MTCIDDDLITRLTRQLVIQPEPRPRQASSKVTKQNDKEEANAIITVHGRFDVRRYDTMQLRMEHRGASK